MEESLKLLHKNNRQKEQRFKALDERSSRYLISTRKISAETSQGDPFEDSRLKIHDEYRNTWKGFGGGLEGGMLQGGSLSMTRPDAIVPLGEYEHVYVRSLLATLRGYPIWFPTPLPRSEVPIEISRKGVLVGDVGLVRGPGSFVSLFNIFLPANHPLNEGRAPDNFVPFRSGSVVDVARRVFMMMPSLPAQQLAWFIEKNQTLAILHFEANGAEGVILGLPCGATSEDLADIPGLRQYIADNIFSWYTFLRDAKYTRLFNGDIRVVIGTDKSTAWTQALFVSPDGISDDDFRVKFTNTKTEGCVRTTYECAGTCLKIMGGPRQTFLDDVRDPEDDSTDYCSHTLFIRTLNTMLSDDYWEAYQSGTTTPSAAGIIARRGLRMMAPLIASPLSVLNRMFRLSASLQRFRPPEKPLAILTGVSKAVQALHPSNNLNRKLLEKMPKARMAITTDYDWLRAVTEDHIFTPEGLNFIADCVLREQTIHHDKGTTYLDM